MLMMTMIDSSQCETWFHLLFGKKANPQQSPYLRNWGAIVVRILIFFMAMINDHGGWFDNDNDGVYLTKIRKI